MEGVICRLQVAGRRLQVAGCRLQVAGQNLQKELNVLSGLHGVLVISYSQQGHTKLEISDLSSINQFFSPRSFKAKRRVLKL